MAADIFIFQDIFVNDKADMVFRIIHQAEDADRTRGDIEILLDVYKRQVFYSPFLTACRQAD